jgi:hypothetical protein
MCRNHRCNRNCTRRENLPENVASSILPDVEGVLTAARKGHERLQSAQHFDVRFGLHAVLAAGQDARLYGSHRGPPLLETRANLF